MIIVDVVCDNCGQEAGIRAARGSGAYTKAWKTAMKMGYHRRYYTKIYPVHEEQQTETYKANWRAMFGHDPSPDPVAIDWTIDLCAQCDKELAQKGSRE